MELDIKDIIGKKIVSIERVQLQKDGIGPYVYDFWRMEVTSDIYVLFGTPLTNGQFPPIRIEINRK